MTSRIASIFFLLCFAMNGFAGVGQKLTLRSLAQSSDVVCTGRVVELRSFFTSGEIWTVATIAMEENLKGDKKSVLRFRIPGGQQQVNGRTLVTRVEGAPVLNINEKALLFLQSGDSDTYDLSGYNQGYWRIDLRDGKETAAPTDIESAPGLSLEYMREEIRESLRSERRQK